MRSWGKRIRVTCLQTIVGRKMGPMFLMFLLFWYPSNKQHVVSSWDVSAIFEIIESAEMIIRCSTKSTYLHQCYAHDCMGESIVLLFDLQLAPRPHHTGSASSIKVLGEMKSSLGERGCLPNESSGRTNFGEAKTICKQSLLLPFKKDLCVLRIALSISKRVNEVLWPKCWIPNNNLRQEHANWIAREPLQPSLCSFPLHGRGPQASPSTSRKQTCPQTYQVNKQHKKHKQT